MWLDGRTCNPKYDFPYQPAARDQAKGPAVCALRVCSNDKQLLPCRSYVLNSFDQLPIDRVAKYNHIARLYFSQEAASVKNNDKIPLLKKR